MIINIYTWAKAKLLLLSILIVWIGSAFLHWDIPYTDYSFYLGYVYISATLAVLSGNARLKRRGRAWWMITDQAVNVVHGGNEDVTVSSKVGYMASKGSDTAQAMEKAINAFWYLIFKQKDHCNKAIERDEVHYD